MGKSSEEFMKQRERYNESIPIISSSFNWDQYFRSFHATNLNTLGNEEGDI